MKPLLFLHVLTFLLLGSSTVWADKPNILVLIVDDLGYGDLSSYGAKDLKTPSIDKLMAAGMRFDSFYANCPVCSPTRAALLSGRYQELVGVPGVVRTHAPNNWGYLAQDAILLPQVLKPEGYHTAIVGKWHLGLEEENQPTRRGFDFFHGFLGDMMDDYYHHRRHGNHYMRRNEEPVHPKGHATDIFTRWAVDYLKERARVVSKPPGQDNPFFLYLAYNAPHTPIQPPADWLARVRQREAGISARVVSMPCMELFAEQTPAYQEETLGKDLPRVVVEAGVRFGWDRWIGARGGFVGMDSFGASAPYQDLYKRFGITPEAVAEMARSLVS